MTAHNTSLYSGYTCDPSLGNYTRDPSLGNYTCAPSLNLLPASCPWCSSPWYSVSHIGKCPSWRRATSGRCPRVRAYEYHPNGTLKRVEFWPEPSTGLDPQVYTVIDGELRLVEDQAPPGAKLPHPHSGLFDLAEEEQELEEVHTL